MDSNKWYRLPREAGVYWFTSHIDDRLLSHVVGVERVITPNYDYYRFADSGDKITRLTGWFLKIEDTRSTAEIDE